MIERRDLMRGLAVGLAITASQSVSACSYTEYDNDDWGRRLVDFLKSGDGSILKGLFQEETTLVAFDTSMLTESEMFFKGKEAVEQALVSFRNYQLMKEDESAARSLVKSRLVGSLQQGRMNKIELTFADDLKSLTSCGPTRNEQSIDLYYEAYVHETGEDWVKWSVRRIALLPHLETERV